MTKILILNGIPDDSFAALEVALEQAIAARPDAALIDTVRLRDKNIKYCTGCWDCWVKTPGICMHNDDFVELYPEILKSDLIVFLSTKSMGFVTSLVKKTCDRMIPLVHPYFEIYQKELHHKSRYKQLPKMGLLLIDPDKHDGDFLTIRYFFERLAINLRTEFTNATSISGTQKEVYDAISTL